MDIFYRESSINSIQSHFEKILSSIIPDRERFNLINELLAVIENDYTIPKVYLEEFENQANWAMNKLRRGDSCYFYTFLSNV